MFIVWGFMKSQKPDVRNVLFSLFVGGIYRLPVDMVSWYQLIYK